MGHERQAAVLTVSSAALIANRDIGVGFWAKADAESFARSEQRRTGSEHETYPEATPFGTRDLWFTRPALQERGAA